METKLKDIVKHELIGFDIEIVASGNRSLVGKRGKVVDETMNTVTIEERGKFKKVLKSQITFRTTFRGKLLEIEGKELVGRPEDRLKRK